MKEQNYDHVGKPEPIEYPSPKFPWWWVILIVILASVTIILHSQYKTRPINTEKKLIEQESILDQSLFSQTDGVHLRSDTIKFSQRFDGSLTVPMIVLFEKGYYDKVNLSFQNGVQDTTIGALYFEIFIKPAKTTNDTTEQN